MFWEFGSSSVEATEVFWEFGSSSVEATEVFWEFGSSSVAAPEVFWEFGSGSVGATEVFWEFGSGSVGATEPLGCGSASRSNGLGGGGVSGRTQSRPGRIYVGAGGAKAEPSPCPRGGVA